MPKRHRQPQITAYAPDGAEIRGLIDKEQGAIRLGLAEALVPVGGSTSKVYHQTIYEEIWYYTQGIGIMHLHHPGEVEEEVFEVVAGDAVLILAGHGFWVENTGAEDLIFLCCGSPPWPGADEAQTWPPGTSGHSGAP